MFLHTWIPQPLIGHLGSLALHWYGLMLAIGAVGGFLICRRLFRRAGFGTELLEELFLLFLVFGLLAARLYHVLNEWTFYAAHPGQILAIWNGGLAIHGAIIGGAIVLLIMAWRKHLDGWLLADLLAPGLAFGQAIGRWGNYFNQELFGRPTALPWGIPIDTAHRPLDLMGSQYFHPTFLYESLGNLVVVAILLWIHRHRGRNTHAWWNHSGVIMGIYLILYSVLRIITESLRIDRVPIIDGIRLPLLVSAIVILLGGAIIIWRQRTPKLSHA